MRECGWNAFVQKTRGESNLAEKVRQLPHKAARVLEHLRKRGASVLTSTQPWGLTTCDAAMRRGPHKSAHNHAEFVFEEILDFCRQGYWTVLPYDSVRDWVNLRISPLGVIPQRDRRPRLIVDYSFSGINNDTVPIAPRESMQFGRALPRILQTVVRADPRYGPVYLSKIDIADGFYRVWLQATDILKLGVALPTTPGQPPLVAFPLALPMGWVESPPYFTTLTETACDLANNHLRARDERPRLTVHRLETVAATPPSDPVAAQEKGRKCQTMRPRMTGHPPVAAVDVYVDDFILMAQTQSQRDKVLRHTLHSIDEVFRPVQSQDPPHRKEPASVKKMLQGDACWATQKRILGWDLDTEASTITLPPHWVEHLYELLNLIRPPRKRVAIKVWHQLLGELRSMSAALPGARGLFSILQDSLSKADRNRVRLTARVWDTVADFTGIADSLRTRPTRLQELVPAERAHFMGASDACQRGMGGVWFGAAGPLSAPLLWRFEFPSEVQDALVTATNPDGYISISDLELTALIAHKDVLARHACVGERTMWIATDNRAALAWSTKGSATSTAARAYLLRYNALHQREHRYVATHSHIAGKANVMADAASRLWHLDDAKLLSHFQQTYPQASPWRMLTLTPSTSSGLIGALFRQRPPPEYRLNESIPLPGPGSCGWSSVPTSKSTPTSSRMIPFPSCKSLPSACAPAPLQPAVDLSGLGQWKTPSAPLVRRMPAWGPRTLA